MMLSWGLVLLLLGVLAVPLLIIAARRRMRSRGATEPSCGQCGYAVRGLTTFTCPECGADLREVGIRTPSTGGRSVKVQTQRS